MVGGTKLPARDLSRAGGIESEGGKTVEEHAPGGARLVPPEPRTDAEVRPGGKREVSALAAVDVVAVRLCPVAGVAVRGSEYRGDECALLECHSRELGLLRRLPRRRPDGRMPAGGLLDCGVDELRVGSHFRQLVGMGENRPERQ